VLDNLAPGVSKTSELVRDCVPCVVQLGQPPTLAKARQRRSGYSVGLGPLNVDLDKVGLPVPLGQVVKSHAGHYRSLDH
jgi:hypothetical protein